MSLTADAIAVRAAPVLLAIVLAGLPWTLAPSSLTRTLAVTAAAAACSGAFAPRSGLPTVTLLVLAGEFTAATSATHGSALVAATVLFTLALWAVHQMFAFAAVVPRDAAVDGSALRRLAARVAATSALAAPAVVLLLVVADVGPSASVLRAVGVVAAAVAALLPTYLVRRQARRGVRSPE